MQPTLVAIPADGVSSQVARAAQRPSVKATGIPLVELGHNQCRFAVHEDRSVPGGHLFCAEATLEGRRYCAEHHRVVTAVELRRGGSSFTAQKRAA